ncbi:hypothetical protein F4604DRAFT_1927512 [Suillus subluteus]|nr:hypothetical protein F4604DRAFT_1927512 [Suillus subluteus]
MSRGTGCTRFNGLSKSVISHSFRGRHRQTHILMAGKQSQRVADADAMHWAEIQEMSTEDRDMVENMITDYGISEMLPHTAPPGEEGLEFSHAGGEHEAFEGLASQITEISGCHYPHTAPPGEEGLEFSHAGGEYDVNFGIDVETLRDDSCSLIYLA